MRILDRSRLVHRLRFAGIQGHLLHEAEDLPTDRRSKLIDQLHRFAGRAVVLNLGLDVYGFVIPFVPDVDTEGFDANLVRKLQLHGAEDAEGLRALAKAHLRRATTADPRHIGNQLGVLGLDLQEVFALAQRLRHIQREHRAPHGMTTQGLAVERDCGIGADTLKVQESALARERSDLETLLVMRRAVQVAVQELTVAVVVVPIMGHGDRLALRLLAFEPGGPPLRKLLHLAALLTLGSYEVHLRTAHRAARRDGNTTLLVVIDRAVEVIDHPVVLYDKALMGKHLVVGLRRVDQIVALPIVPGHQVVAAGEGVVGQIGARRIEGREVKHDIHIAHFDDLGIARDRALCLVREDRVAGIALPLLHILRQGDADALALVARLGILAACVVVHHEGGTECLRAIPIDHALILHEALPPLHILILDGENRSFRGLPRVGLRGILLRPCQADVERCLHRLIATACATDVGHPATVLELLQLIRPAPLHID